MPIEMGLWRLNGVEAVPVPTSSLATEQRLEEVLEADPSVLGLDLLLIVGRQVPTGFGGYVDLLALDAQGNVVVVELKRNRTPRDVVAQALDYGSWVEKLGFDELLDVWDAYDASDTDLDAAFAARFGEAMPDDLNSSHRLVIVAAELNPSTERIVEYLGGFEVPVDVVLFSYLQDGDAEYLARSWLTDPEPDGATSKKKRPWNGRDFYVSFGINEHDERRWEDARRFGFISAGGGVWYSRTLNALKPGHRVFVYIPGEGYVGVGEVVEPVQPVSEFIVADGDRYVPLLEVPDLQAAHMDHDVGDAEKDEYLVRVKWTKTLARGEAFKEPGLFANQNSAVKLRHTQTIRRLEQHFGLTNGA
jgi:hypothetical protein